ncbi:lebercilin-like protein isoform X2 [Rhinoderma darwinii]|uniref:lebercilin-like protein isoform X2 n=1 Tax=Rhinoderma darwinii TaxID=43563 RepID=UPI003F677038
MSFEVGGGDTKWRQEPSTDTEQRSFSRPNDPTESPSSASSSTTPSNRSNTSGSNRSSRDNSYSEMSESVNETQKNAEKMAEKVKIKMCQTFPKVDKRFPWRKSPPWKRSSLKPQHLPFTTPKVESDVTQHVLSAQVRKIKELKDEMCDIQRTLDTVNRENRLLNRLQHRHMKALQKYESSEEGVHHLISRHSNEIRTLRDNLRTTQESERGLCRKLKMAESELLKEKDSLRRLQRLSEDKNLAEREELNNNLSSLLIKMEIDSTKVKALEKQLHLMARFYDRQLALESKKASEARDITRKLQDEILLQQQTIKEKERELHIKNIYAHRMPRNIWKYGDLYGQGGLTFTRSTQTESEMFTQGQTSAHEEREYRDPPDKNIECENDSAKEEDNNSQTTSEEAPTSEVFQAEDNDFFLEIDGKYKEQVKETEGSTEGPYKIILEEHFGPEEPRHYEKNQLEDLCHENEAERRVGFRDTRSFLPRLNRHYTFTAATVNLHQGLPANGPITSVVKAHSCKSLMLHRDPSLGHEELSLPKIQTGNCNDNRGEKCPEVSMSVRKKNLMEELFGPGYDEKNNFSSDFLSSDKEFDL